MEENWGEAEKEKERCVDFPSSLQSSNRHYLHTHLPPTKTIAESQSPNIAIPKSKSKSKFISSNER